MVLYDNKYHSPYHCPKCESETVMHLNKEYINHDLCEVEVHCCECGAVAFWAYGFYDIEGMS